MLLYPHVSFGGFIYHWSPNDQIDKLTHLTQVDDHILRLLYNNSLSQYVQKFRTGLHII